MTTVYRADPTEAFSNIQKSKVIEIIVNEGKAWAARVEKDAEAEAIKMLESGNVHSH